MTPSSIYGANDGGSNWLPLHDDTEKIESADILSIAMSPADENLALFGTVDNGIIRTSDKGQNFEFLTNFKAEKVYGLELDPRDPRIIYASGVWQKRGKIYKSQDSGETWKEIYTEPADGPLIVSMVLSGTSGDILYVGNSDGAVFRSLNQGATWSRIFSSDYPITKIIVGKKNAGQIFLISDSGQVFRGDGSRGGFSDITSNIKKTITADGGIFAGDFDSRGTLYLGGKIGLIKSSDGGNSWSDIPVLNDSENFPIRALAVNPGNDREIIFDKNMYQEAIKRKEGDFEKVIEHFQKELGQIRTGRASSALVENLLVDYYGSKSPIKQVASITIPEPRTITISPWDKGSLVGIESAIRESQLGLAPVNDGQVVRINIPPLTEERRKEMVKMLNQKSEEARVGIRRTREEIWDEIQEMEKSGQIGEDDKFSGKDSLQEVVDGYNGKIEEIRKKKEEEIMTV